MAKILLAEDERELSAALVTLLGEFGFDITPVYDGQAVIEEISQNTYDGIVMDIMMPKKNGIEALKEIRAMDISTPVLLLTAKSETEDIVTGLELGASDYLTKPFVTRELVARINSMLRNMEEAHPQNLEYGNIILDFNENLVYTEKRSMSLANDEVSLLAMLIKGKGRFIKSEDIAEKIWQNGEVEGQLTLYISYIEKKLSAVDSLVKIENNGSGYRLVIEND